MKVRDYQADLIERCRRRLRQGLKRILVQAPVGAGKTIITSEITHAAVAKGKRVLFLAHRRRLIDQKSKKLDSFGVPHGILMAGVKPAPWRNVQVASRDTILSRTVRNDWIDPPLADLVIVDEAHRVLSTEYQSLLALYPEAVHLGVTATPAREDGRGLGSFYEAMECCVPISRLIAEGWLCPVRCYAPQNLGKKRTASTRKLAGDPVESWKRLGEDRPTVLFTSKVATSLDVCAAFNAAGIPAEHIDAHTSDETREEIVSRVEKGITKILCNVGVFTEGVDIPCLSCCVLLRMAGSYTLFIQCIGRIMRAFPGKKDAILIDHSDAVLEHGFPDEDVEWNLDEQESVDARNQRDRKDGKRSTPVVCPSCGVMFAAAAICPTCGSRLPRRLQPPALRNQLLTEVERGLTPEAKREWQVRFWHGCLAAMAKRNSTCGAAAMMYRRKYGDWPPEDFPNNAGARASRDRVADRYPQYLGRVTA